MDEFQYREADAERRLDTLFAAYRDACEYRDSSPNFMPRLWTRIQKAQTISFSFRRMARGFVTVAMALSLVLALIGLFPRREAPPAYSSTYVEVLAAHNAPEGADYIETSHSDNWDDAELL